MSELEARRERARGAYWSGGGAFNDPEGHPEDAEAAIEVATRVRITPELLAVFGRAWQEADEQGTHVPGARRAAGLKAAFEAAGFEVEQ